MSAGSIIGGTLRAVVIAAATAAAAFGLLVVLQPFGRSEPAPATVTVSGTPAASALQKQIETVRVSLRDAETALDAAAGVAQSANVSPDAATRLQYEAQIAAATERRDLALRHAEAIRASLAAGVTPSSLAEIRDSVVIGQLLVQQVALDGKIAIEGARLRANHPSMRALNAQRTALASQIREEAASIAAALESEAKIDAAQIELLQSQLPALSDAPRPAAIDTAALEAKAAALRVELDGLVDAYFNIPPATVTTSSRSAAPADPLSVMNLAVVGIAALAALVFQVLLAVRRRRLVKVDPADMAAWQRDRDPEAVVVAEPEPLRKAS